MIKIDSQHFIIGIFAVLLIVSVSGCTSSDNSTSYSGSTKVYSWEGVTFNIPSSWEANESSNAMGPTVYFYDPQKSEYQLIVTKIDTITYNSAEEAANADIKTFKEIDSYESSRNFTVNGTTAYEVVTTPGSESEKLVSVYIEPKSGQIYVIKIGGTSEDISQQRQYLNLVLNSFKA